MSTTIDWPLAGLPSIHRPTAALLPHLRRKVGQTPVQRIQTPAGYGQVWVKKEWEQISGSVKARAAFQIIEDAVLSGQLHPGRTLLDATSGNTGIAYAAIARELGIPVTLCLPENASRQRKEILQSLGAQLHLTSRFEGTDGAQEVARDLYRRHPETFFYADQYNNPNNWKAHYTYTAPEIVAQVPDITHFVAALGSTGTFTGTGRRLREILAGIRLVALQPDSPMHGLEGWKHLETAVVPGIFDDTLADEVLEIGTADAYDMIRRAHTQNKLRLSPSAAANLFGALHLAARDPRAVVVTVLADNADKYDEVMQQIFPR
jgi:S-sulfo-L-cysteine synthase (O-acetyl-L-serine-dependent)